MWTIIFPYPITAGLLIVVWPPKLWSTKNTFTIMNNIDYFEREVQQWKSRMVNETFRKYKTVVTLKTVLKLHCRTLSCCDSINFPILIALIVPQPKYDRVTSSLIFFIKTFCNSSSESCWRVLVFEQVTCNSKMLSFFNAWGIEQIIFS